MALFLLLITLTPATHSQTPTELLAKGDYDAAMQAATQALQSHQQSHDEKAQTDDWNTIGSARLYQGKYADGIDALEHALALDRKRRDPQGEIIRLYNIGGAYVFLGRYADAFRYYQSALDRANSTTSEKWNPRVRQVTLANLANLYQRLGRYQQALELYLSLKPTLDVLTPSVRAQLLANQGTLYRRLGDPSKALATYREAQQLYSTDHHRDGEISVLKNIGIVLALDLDRLPEALLSFQASLHLAQQSANAQVAPGHLYLAEALIRASRWDQAKSEFEAALSRSRAVKSAEYEWRALYGLGRLAQHNGNPTDALQAFQQAIARIESVRSSLELSALRREFLADKREVYDAAISLLLHQPNPPTPGILSLMESGRARVLQDKAATPTLSSIQSQLDGATALLEFWEGPDEAAVLYLTRTSSGVLPRSPIDGKALRDAALTSHASPSLLDGIPPLSDPRIQRLIIIPDGQSALVPFDLLPAPPAGILLNRATIQYAPSAAILLTPQKAPTSWRLPWNRQLLAFADPATTTSALFDPSSLAPLPKAREEVAAIAATLPGRAEIHSGPDARKSYLSNESLRSLPVLHIASHASADPFDSDRSRILFAPQDPKQGTDFLFYKEIPSLDFKDVSLVVLSACDTETGKYTRGEGVEGFSRAFLSAGAASTVTTLWRVEDHATSEFMKQFYFFLAAGQPKADALRLAKLRFQQSGVHPRHWAAFVLNGDGQNPLPKVLPWYALALPPSLLLALVLLTRTKRPTKPKPSLTN